MVVFPVVPVLDLHCVRGQEDGGLRWAVYVVVQDAFFYLEERVSQKERSAATNSSVNLLSMEIEQDAVCVSEGPGESLQNSQWSLRRVRRFVLIRRPRV